MILFPANKRHRETTRLFAVITQKSVPISEAPHLDWNASGHLKASFTLAFACVTQVNKNGRGLGGKLALDLSH